MVSSVLPAPETQGHMCPGIVCPIKGVKGQRRGVRDKVCVGGEGEGMCIEHKDRDI